MRRKREGDEMKKIRGRKEEEKRISCVVTFGSWFLFACVFGYLTELLTRIDGDGSRISTRRPFLVCGGGHCLEEFPVSFFFHSPLPLSDFQVIFVFFYSGVVGEKTTTQKKEENTSPSW